MNFTVLCELLHQCENITIYTHVQCHSTHPQEKKVKQPTLHQTTSLWSLSTRTVTRSLDFVGATSATTEQANLWNPQSFCWQSVPQYLVMWQRAHRLSSVPSFGSRLQLAQTPVSPKSSSLSILAARKSLRIPCSSCIEAGRENPDAGYPDGRSRLSRYWFQIAPAQIDQLYPDIWSSVKCPVLWERIPVPLEWQRNSLLFRYRLIIPSNKHSIRGVSCLIRTRNSIRYKLCLEAQVHVAHLFLKAPVGGGSKGIKFSNVWSLRVEIDQYIKYIYIEIDQYIYVHYGFP